MRTVYYIDDYGLTPKQLDDKYNPDGDGEHSGYPRSGWRFEVREQSTISGYWDWLRHQLQLEEDELDRDNPYNQGDPT
jgi:hypothetical protein